MAQNLNGLKFEQSGIDWEKDVSEIINLLILNNKRREATILVKRFVGKKTVSIEGKERQQFTFEVLDLDNDSVEKTWNIVQSRLINALREHEPFINKTLFVERIGTGMETQFEITDLNKSKSKKSK